MRLTKKNAASAEAWAKVSQAAIDAKVGVKVGDSVTISVAEPFVFGFEVVQLNYVTQQLGSKPNDVVLVPIPADLFQR